MADDYKLDRGVPIAMGKPTRQSDAATGKVRKSMFEAYRRHVWRADENNLILANFSQAE